MAVADGNFETYYQALRTRFAGKDATRLPGRLKGTITFLFREHGAVADRLTLRFSDEGVHVDAVTRLHEGEATAIVRCTLADWIAFFENNDTTRMDEIDFFGDAQLIEALPTLAAQKTSPLHARLASRSTH
ncbi:MAG: hypothetical protein HYS27_12810 [Deltaproteobacteria bacterium]|nr:hypothetical protein [Deltaproteobacteria bacterium]